MRAFHVALLIVALALVAMLPAAAAMSNGAPQLNCVACHVGADKNPVDFVIEGLPKVVEPGKEYKITIKITKGPESKGAAYGGFAVAASAGKLVVTDQKDTFITTVTVNGQQVPVITHTKEGSMKREWTFAWVAPKDCKGPIKFEIAVLAANGDGSPMGDAYAHKVIEVECKAATPTPTTTTIVTTTTKVVTTTTPVTLTTTEQVSNPALAAGVAVAIFVIVVGLYMVATRGKGGA